ncbi:WD domain, G-beta repeat-containing protein [Besnoitia besnoiti]|uniref:WD domain, G-beta repeat-containing protein n=1 Tax=Besnoitia besnoiti TaxID=94643 RepID=A0A2A9M6C6_BESBE|nr:WD domain, G-beta repeat-containing protein [Besnoitia besnoiti]PFH34028.1 WD domain, G-beta repeat-containing protein [Besnoitia besnoiti]
MTPQACASSSSVRENGQDECFLDPSQAVDAEFVLPRGEGAEDDVSMNDEGPEDDEDDGDEVDEDESGFPAAPPGCRWVIETPEGEFLDMDDASASVCPELVAEASRRLRATCEGATDALVAAASLSSPSRFGGRPLVALGSCDDKCRLYLLRSSSLVAEGREALSADAAAGPLALQPSAVLSEGKDTVSATAFSFDGKLLACGCFDGDVRVYLIPADDSAASSSSPSSSSSSSSASASSVSAEAFPVSLLHALTGPAQDVTAVAFHPRGYAVLAASADQTAWVWLLPASLSSAKRAAAPVVLSVFVGSAPLTACAFSADGRNCIVGAEDGSVSVYEAKSGQTLFAFAHPALNPQVQDPGAFVPRPQLLGFGRDAAAPLRADGDAEEDAETARGVVALKLFAGGADEAAAAAGLEGLVCVGYEDGWILLFHEKTGKIHFASSAHLGSVEAVEFVPPPVAASPAAPAPATPTPTPTPTPTAVAADELDSPLGLEFFAPSPRADRASRVGALAAWREQLQQGCLVTAGLEGGVFVWSLSQKKVRASLSLAALSRAAFPALAAAAAKSAEGAEGEARAAEEGPALFAAEEGFTRICRHPRGLPLALAGTTEGKLVLLDLRRGEPLSVWAAHAGAVMEIRSLARGAPGELPREREWEVLSAGEDGLGKLWSFDVLEELRGGASQA